MIQSWFVVGASNAGVSHERSGLPCQDKHELHVRDELLFVVVADGAGSAPQSELGASLAVSSVLRFLLAEITMPQSEDEIEANLRHSFLAAANELCEESARLGVPRGELACTLLAVIASPNLVTAAQVGDGSVVVLANGEAFGLTSPIRGEFFNESTFITSSRWAEKLQIARKTGPFDLLAVFTDGIQSVALDLSTDKPYTPFFLSLAEFAARSTCQDSALIELNEFLCSNRLRSRTDDDVTLVLAVPRSC